MAKFVQINWRAFNPDLITDITFEEEEIRIFFAFLNPDGEQSWLSFADEDKEAFEIWWRERADVCVID